MSCSYWDSGWCYRPESIYQNGCVGSDKCCYRSALTAGQEEIKKLKKTIEKLENPRNYNIGSSDYAKRKIQPWDIWLEYNLNPWDADIIKRILRNKEGDSKRLDYEKIKHICDECIRQIDLGASGDMPKLRNSKEVTGASDIKTPTETKLQYYKPGDIENELASSKE